MENGNFGIQIIDRVL